MISVEVLGGFNSTIKAIKKMERDYIENKPILKIAGQKGINALRSATPHRSGKTAGSWYYEIIEHPDSIELAWLNSNINHGVNIAVIIQYGHGTGTGGYVQGIDYINPAIRPVFEGIASDLERRLKR